MKRTVSIEMVLVVLFVGAALGLLISQWLKMEGQLINCGAQIAQQNARLAALETERSERVNAQIRTKGVLGIASRCLKLTWGLFKDF